MKFANQGKDVVSHLNFSHSVFTHSSFRSCAFPTIRADSSGSPDHIRENPAIIACSLFGNGICSRVSHNFQRFFCASSSHFHAASWVLAWVTRMILSCDSNGMCSFGVIPSSCVSLLANWCHDDSLRNGIISMLDVILVCSSGLLIGCMLQTSTHTQCISVRSLSMPDFTEHISIKTLFWNKRSRNKSGWLSLIHSWLNIVAISCIATSPAAWIITVLASTLSFLSKMASFSRIQSIFLNQDFSKVLCIVLHHAPSGPIMIIGVSLLIVTFGLENIVGFIYF